MCERDRVKERERGRGREREGGREKEKAGERKGEREREREIGAIFVKKNGKTANKVVYLVHE